MESVRVRVRVRGRVQGVWFRGSTEQRATEFGLCGWVCNRSDGSVELEAQGAPAMVQALVSWCRSGPELACVEDVEVTQLEPTAGECGFAITR